MKKFVVAILAIVYLSTSVGATIRLHYCMGKLVNWGLSHSNKAVCSNCGMRKCHSSTREGCCSDEYKQIKNEKDQKLSESFVYLNKVLIETAPVTVDGIAPLPPSFLTSEFLKINAPPRSSRNSILALHCIFRI